MLIDKPAAYWKHFENRVGPIEPEFKDMIEKMFEVDPAFRLNMADLMSHPWIKNNLLTPEQF